MTAQEYRSHVSTSINHIRERLLVVRERLNTSYARDLAEDAKPSLSRSCSGLRTSGMVGGESNATQGPDSRLLAEGADPYMALLAQAPRSSHGRGKQLVVGV